MSELKLTGVSKSYAAMEVLSSVDLEVAKGEFVTLLGPSGSGKTTLLKIIAGITDSSKGKIEIGGVDATNLHARDRGLAMVFQNYALVPHMTVFDNVAFPLKVRRLTKIEIRQKVMKVLATVRLEQFAGRKPGQLSGGQQQRVAIARALVYDPSLVLMDEPLGALDKQLRDQLQEEISRLHRSLGITVIYVTHDQQEAMSMSDRIVLMKDGAIEQIASPEELYQRPGTAFAAQFLGESNFLPGTAVKQGGTLGIRLDGGEIVSPPRDAKVVDGEKVRILVRPERIAVLWDGERPMDGANSIQATTDGRTFVGGTTRYQLRLSDGVEVRVTDSAAPRFDWSVTGRPVKLAWLPEESILFS